VKWQGKVIVYCICAFFAFFVLRAIVARIAWNAQPASVKAAAAKLQQDLIVNAKVHDLIRFKDGHLAMVMADPRQDGKLRLSDCGAFDMFSSENLSEVAEQAVARIPFSSPEYGSAAKECLSRY
jgi:hypothetical protein